MDAKADQNSVRARKVENVRRGTEDFACEPILCVYTYNPPFYAIYRTATRVMVHFADDPAIAAEQRKRIARLAPLRGQISGLIDGWHSAKAWFRNVWSKVEEADDGKHPNSVRSEHRLRKRADRYDRRSADAIGLALEGDIDTAMALLAEIKNDIIGERTAIARIGYLLVAVFITAIVLLALSIALWEDVPEHLGAVWIGIFAGTFGALFSIALGLKSRTVLIDLQNRMNIFDASLRMLIGAMSGGILICLMLSGLVDNLVKVEALQPGGRDYAPLLIFMVGFLGGFFERLVPDLLKQTNLGTTEATGAAGGTAAAAGAPVGGNADGTSGSSDPETRRSGGNAPPPSAPATRRLQTSSGATTPPGSAG